MARTVDEINSYLIDAFVLDMATIGITINTTTWSKRNMFRMFLHSVAVGQALVEQLQDAYKAVIEDVVSKAAPASAKWVQDKMFKFQFSSTNPQFVVLVDTVPVYPIVDPSLRIITACSVTSDISNAVNVKVAKNIPFEALTTAEKSSAQGYINTIGIVGIKYNVISLNSDKIYIEADVFYQGQYASVIQATVIATINAFLANLSVDNFDGSLKMSDLEDAIRESTGVSDVVLKNVRGRADADPFSAGIDLILNNAVIQRQWNTIAGYIGEETTTGKTLADTLTFTAE